MADWDPLGSLNSPPQLTDSPLVSTRTARIPDWSPGSTPGTVPGALTDWDKLVVAGQVMPGRAILTGDRGQKLDVKKSPGSDGSTVTNTGLDNGNIQVKFLFWTREQVDAWGDWVKIFEPKPGKSRPDPVDVYHPALALAHIKSLLPQKVGILQPEPSMPGVLSVTVRFMEFAPAVKAKTVTSKKSQSITDGKNVKQALPGKKPSETENHP